MTREVTKWPPHRLWFLEWRWRGWMTEIGWRLHGVADWFIRVGQNRPSITGGAYGGKV